MIIWRIVEPASIPVWCTEVLMYPKYVYIYIYMYELFMEYHTYDLGV